MEEIFTDNIRRKCFFCSKTIMDKKTDEHIIPNSLLGKLGLKEKTIEGIGSFLYSRIKVPAHKDCNSEFGSRYENKVLQILDNPTSLYKSIVDDENNIDQHHYPTNNSIDLVTTWLTKVYYGLFYKDYLSLDKPEWSQICREIIECENFKLTQKAYQNNHGFTLPSSLFAFQTNDNEFDIKTFAHPQTILIKIANLTLILCVADGFLTKSYMNRQNLIKLRQQLVEHHCLNPHIPGHLIALSEVLALRLSIPKSPKFISSDNHIINLSFNTLVKDPNNFYRINENILNENRTGVLELLNIKLV